MSAIASPASSTMSDGRRRRRQATTLPTSSCELNLLCAKLGQNVTRQPLKALYDLWLASSFPATCYHYMYLS